MSVIKIFSALCALLTFFSVEAFADIDKGFDADHVRVINEARERARVLPQLYYSETLSRAARVRAEEISRVWSDDRPDGSAWSTVLGETSGYVYSSYGQNIRAGGDSAQQAASVWELDDEYKKNVVDPRYTRVGVATFTVDEGVGGSGHKIYWVAIFADSAEDRPTIPGGSSAFGPVFFGTSQVWLKGSKAPGLSFILDRVAADIKDVEVDGTTRGKFAYSAVSADAPNDGRTLLTINKILLDNISVGSHSARVVCSDDQDIPMITFASLSYENDYSSSFSASSSSWNKNSDSDLDFFVDGRKLEELMMVMCDDSPLSDGADYRASDQNGGVKITLAKGYLSRISAGSHQLTASFTTGTGDISFNTIDPDDPVEPRSSSGGGCAIAPAFLVAAAHIIRRRNKGR